MKLTELCKLFINDGMDDIELEKDNNRITIGYFHSYPTWVIHIDNNILMESLFDRWEKTEWIFRLIDSKTEVVDDVFFGTNKILSNDEVLSLIGT